MIDRPGREERLLRPLFLFFSLCSLILFLFMVGSCRSTPLAEDSSPFDSVIVEVEPLMADVERPREVLPEIFLPVVSFPVVFSPPSAPDPTQLVGIELPFPAPLMPEQFPLYPPPLADDSPERIVAIPLPDIPRLKDREEKREADGVTVAEDQTPDDDSPTVEEKRLPAESAAASSSIEEPTARKIEQSEPSSTGPVFDPYEDRMPTRLAVTRAERTITAGQRFSISLKGTGWLFLGSSIPVDFIGRERLDDEVIFTFRSRVPAPSPHEVDASIELAFEMQDLTAGDRYRHEEQVVLARAGRVEKSGRDGEPAEYRRNDMESAGQATIEPLNQRIQTAADREGPLTSEDESLLREIFDEGIEHPHATLALVERLVTAPVRSETIALLEALLEQGSPRYDFVLFSLARLYEVPGAHRDLQRSHDLYTRVVDEYPLSDYWERASARIEYLERHFFYIR